MRRVTLDKTAKTATVQPGAKWIDVYNYLDPLVYAIPGGRAGDVGVGGLTSGGMFKTVRGLDRIATANVANVLVGGNSFFAARYGFACDNVRTLRLVHPGVLICHKQY